MAKRVTGAGAVSTVRYSRTPTRLTRWMPLDVRSDTSAQMTAYRLPSAASFGTSMTAVVTACAFAATSTLGDLMRVQSAASLLAWPSAQTNLPFATLAAPAY